MSIKMPWYERDELGVFLETFVGKEYGASVLQTCWHKFSSS